VLASSLVTVLLDVLALQMLVPSNVNAMGASPPTVKFWDEYVGGGVMVAVNVTG
jgi:hypothetical protein